MLFWNGIVRLELILVSEHFLGFFNNATVLEVCFLLFLDKPSTIRLSHDSL